MHMWRLCLRLSLEAEPPHMRFQAEPRNERNSFPSLPRFPRYKVLPCNVFREALPPVKSRGSSPPRMRFQAAAQKRVRYVFADRV